MAWAIVLVANKDGAQAMEGTHLSLTLTSELRQNRWGRLEQAEFLQQADTIWGSSQRQASTLTGVPRSTLQHWEQRRAAHGVSQGVSRFLESPDGVVFLHKLTCALHLVFQQVGPCGTRLICDFLHLTDLDHFVAASYGAQYQVSLEVQQALRQFGEEERARLGPQMERREITACQDETFHPQMCLVAMEPVSGFIIVETYAQNRDADTWTQVMNSGLESLNVDVIQSVSDESRSLVKHVKEGLGVAHSPDLFHVQKDLHRGFASSLNSAVQQAEKNLQAANAEAERIRQERDKFLPCCNDPEKLKADYDQQLRSVEIRQEALKRALDEAVNQREQALADMRKISDDYHPFHLGTAAPQDAETVKANLNAGFDAMENWAERLKLSNWARKKIARARKVLPLMIDTIAFFWSLAKVKLAALDLGLPESERQRLMEDLLGSAYLERAAKKARNAKERKRIQELSQQLLKNARDGPLGSLSEAQQAKALSLAASCADLFQRSSSCVEGRNGQLALRHHSLHSLSDLKLASLTTVHNYLIRRDDGTTAAERFFEVRHRDLFPWLLEKLPLPRRPKRRTK